MKTREIEKRAKAEKNENEIQKRKKCLSRTRVHVVAKKMN